MLDLSFNGKKQSEEVVFINSVESNLSFVLSWYLKIGNKSRLFSNTELNFGYN